MNSLVLTNFSLTPNKLSAARNNNINNSSYSLSNARSKICCIQTNHSSSLSTTVSNPIITQKPGNCIVLQDDDDTFVNYSTKNNGIGIVQYLEGKTYFLTGGTGFLGKAIIEKILRAAPDLCKIYVLIKADNNEAACERLKTEVIDSDLFDNLRVMHGKSYEAFMSSKVVPVIGNVCEDSNLGIDSILVKEMVEKVDVIINSVANTTFDERYDVALNTNTKGPSRVLNFAKKCNKLCVFLHISTAYVNGEREGRVMEKPFKLGDSIMRERSITSKTSPILDIDVELKLAFDSNLAFHGNEGGRDQKLKELGLQRARSFGWRNTYEFTKAMGEMLLNENRGEIPVAIVRPSIIQSPYKEPCPGWMEGNRMLDPLILLYGKGYLPGFFGNPEATVDVIPLDIVVNSIIAAMANHGIAKKPSLKVYHVASSGVNPLLIRELFDFSYEYFNSSQVMDSKGKTVNIKRMKFISSSIDDFSSYISEATLQQNGLMDSERHEKRCKKIVDHITYLAKLYEPYMFYLGRFDNGNTNKLLEIMSDEEKQTFGFNIESMDWKDFLVNIHIPGLRKHVMKGRGMIAD